jgi:azurin
MKSDLWKHLVAASSLSKYPEFGVALNGHLALQDWTNGVAFRNIKLKDLGQNAEVQVSQPGPAKSQAAADSMERSVPGAEKTEFTDTIRLQANDKSLMIAHSKLLAGGGSDQVEFTISQPGVYPFMCSFPGHWGTMQGKIIAE